MVAVGSALVGFLATACIVLLAILFVRRRNKAGKKKTPVRVMYSTETTVSEDEWGAGPATRGYWEQTALRPLRREEEREWCGEPERETILEGSEENIYTVLDEIVEI